MALRDLVALLACLVTGCAATPQPGSETPSAPVDAPAPTPFVEQHVEGLGNPEVVIINETTLPISIDLGGPSSQNVAVPPSGTQTVSIAPGAYTFAASAPGVEGTAGSQAFDADERYTWTFRVAGTPQQ